MANYEEPEPELEHESEYLDWCRTRPDMVRVVAERFRPWKLYRMASTGHRVIPLSFSEPEQDGGKVTMRVAVLAEYNAVAFERQVFGIDPDDLTECEWPAAGEQTGAVLTQQEVHDNIDTLRALAGIKVKG